MPSCDYFFVCVSPWTYLGHARFLSIARAHQIEVRVKPVHLGEIFPLSGGLPLAKRAPQRQAYRLVELERWRARTGLPLRLHPKYFPADDRTAARCVIAADQIEGPLIALRLVGALLRLVWAEDGDIANLGSLHQTLTAEGLNADRLLAEAETPQVHAQYAAYTREAVDAQVFGVPWYRFEGVPYWGQDRLDFLEEAFARSTSATAPDSASSV